MIDLTKDELYALVQDKFKNVMDELQTEVKRNMDLYPAISDNVIAVIGFAIATMIRNGHISKEEAVSMTIDDIDSSIDGFLAAFHHYDNLN